MLTDHRSKDSKLGKAAGFTTSQGIPGLGASHWHRWSWAKHLANDLQKRRPQWPQVANVLEITELLDVGCFGILDHVDALSGPTQTGVRTLRMLAPFGRCWAKVFAPKPAGAGRRYTSPGAGLHQCRLHPLQHGPRRHALCRAFAVPT